MFSIFKKCIGIRSSTGQKRYNVLESSEIELTTKSDEIACENSGPFRALLSCGHICDPNSLFGWCKTQLNDGKSKFTCPALTRSGQTCAKEWPYDEVRRLGLLTQSKSELFEAKLNQNAIMSEAHCKQCPQCSSFIERSDVEKKCLKMQCVTCRVSFCWQCNQIWKSEKKDNETSCARYNCRNRELEILKNCMLITISTSHDLRNVPSIRACIKCGNLVEHSGSGCKNVICPRCDFEFCFACLASTKRCERTSKGCYDACSKPIAPIQTKITS